MCVCGVYVKEKIYANKKNEQDVVFKKGYS